MDVTSKNKLHVFKLKNSIKLGVVDKTILLLFGLYFVLSPWYFWSSGLPQVADIIMVLTMILFLLKKRFSFSITTLSSKFLGTGLIFICWIIIINLIWAFRLQTDSFFKPTLFYIYNFLVASFTLCMALMYKESLKQTIVKAITLSILLQFLLFIIDGGYTGNRMTGTFNNPNQLGYYSLLVMAYLIFIGQKMNIKKGWFIISFVSATALQVAALSSTAIASFVGLILSFLIKKSDNKKLKRCFLIFIIGASFVFIFVNYQTTIIKEGNALIGMQNRIARTGDKVDNFSRERGYYRITEYPEYWLFGSGEGQHHRFGTSNEFHSTIGVIQLSYGIIGLLLFLRILYLSLKADRFKNWYIIFFLLTYGLTHNGVRNSMLWILLALMIAYGNSHKNNGTPPMC